MATTTIQYVDPLDRPGALVDLIATVRSVEAGDRRGGSSRGGGHGMGR